MSTSSRHGWHGVSLVGRLTWLNISMNDIQNWGKGGIDSEEAGATGDDVANRAAALRFARGEKERSVSKVCFRRAARMEDVKEASSTWIDELIDQHHYLC